MESKVNVTKSFLPPQEEYQALLQRAWSSNWLTNRGELVRSLEEELTNYLSVRHILLTNNGTSPLHIALKLLGNKGEIITTPFSYVATTSSILWEECTPVFVDIHPEYLTIDETKIEAAITDKTTAILATHVFGNPCEVEKIEAIARAHNLKVIYDAAHSFATQYKGQPVFNFGDISTCSFHATKIFHTGEGGCIISNDPSLDQAIFLSHNFGHTDYENISTLGTNAKMSELQAAMGLAVLPHMESILAERQRIVETYVKNLEGSNIQMLRIREGTQWNYHYFPVILPTEAILLNLQQELNAAGIYPRRYFYPSLNTLPFLANSQPAPVSESIASRVFCLPLYVGLSLEKVNFISKIVSKACL